MLKPNQNLSIYPQRLRLVVNTKELYDDGFLRVEHPHYYASCGKKIIKLGRAEFLILSVLVQNINRIITGEQIWDYVWQGKKAFNQDSLRVLIYRLRRNLAPSGISIETMVKIGYKLVS